MGYGPQAGGRKEGTGKGDDAHGARATPWGGHAARTTRRRNTALRAGGSKL